MGKKRNRKKKRPEAENEGATTNTSSTPMNIPELADFLNEITIDANNEPTGVKPKTPKTLSTANFGDEAIGRAGADSSVCDTDDPVSGPDLLPDLLPDFSQLILKDDDQEDILEFHPSMQDKNRNIQQLQAVFVNTKLPKPQFGQCVCYDGVDCIYILGGWMEHRDNDAIYLFSISTHTIKQVGSLPRTSAYGVAIMWPKNDGSNTNIFYFGGHCGRDVYKFNTETKVCSMVAELPYSITHGTCLEMTDDSNMVYVVGGNTEGKKCIAFDMKSMASRVMEKPSFCPYPSTAVQFTCGAVKKAFFYGGNFSSGLETLHEFNLRNLTWRPVGHDQYPLIAEIGRSVGDGRFMYLIGGYSMSSSTSTFRTGGITQFDPMTLQSRFIPVKNFPVGQDGYDDRYGFYWDISHYDVAPDCVYVNGLNRIYFFGGRIDPSGKLRIKDPIREFRTDHIVEFRNSKDIFYIDLCSSTTPQ